MKTVLGRVGGMAAALVLATGAGADDNASDGAPFGLRFGMKEDAVTFKKLDETIEEGRSVTLPGVGALRKPRIVRHPLLTQCEKAFDQMAMFALFNEAWLDWTLSKAAPVQDFNVHFLLERDEIELGPSASEVAAQIDFTKQPTVEDTIDAFDEIHDSDVKFKLRVREAEAMSAYTGKGPLLDVLVQAPEERYVPHERFAAQTWQGQMIAERIGQHRTVAGYEVDAAGQPRRMCLVFGAEGLISVYVPQSEIADVWPGIVGNLEKDARFKTYAGDISDGDLKEGFTRKLVHAAWVDEGRSLSVVAYVAGLAKPWFGGGDSDTVKPDAIPYIMYTNLERRAKTFQRFHDEVRPSLVGEAFTRKTARDEAQKAQGEREAKEKDDKDALIRAFQ